MKTNIQKKTVVIVLSILTILVFTFTSCQKEQLAPSGKRDLSEISPSEKIAQTNYAYLLGEEPIEGPDKTVAPNGDTIIIEGSGTLSIHPKSVTGGGQFEHVNAAGTVLGSGTWQALELLSFVSWGSSTDPTLPESFEAGKALVRIHLSPDAGGDGHDGILQISCVLPGANFPAGFEEGIRLVVPQVANFNDPVHGQTLFIHQ